jgi:hypothetical protein
MMSFFGEIGCVFPQFPYIAHSRGWTAEDMEENVAALKKSESLREGAATLVDRAMALAATLLAGAGTEARIERAGRKAFDPAAHSAGPGFPVAGEE